MSEDFNPVASEQPGRVNLRSRASWFRNFAGWLTSFLIVVSSPSEAKESGSGVMPLFQSATTLKLELHLPWQALVSDEFFYQGAYPSILTYTDHNGVTVSFPLAAERRGWSRQVICQYPPLKLRFSRDRTEGTVFEGQKTLKLAIPCEAGEDYEQYLVLEELAYRMFNLVSDFGFRVRPLSLTVIDSETDKVERPRFAFLIENDHEVAERNGQRTLKMAVVRPDQLDPLEASKLALFEYMIANSDWSLEPKPDEENCCDNLKPVGQESEAKPVYLLPNDFDQSGLVNARYAKSAENKGNHVGVERVFRGFCVHNAELGDARKLFLDRQDEIRALVTDENRLLDERKTQTLLVLQRFFDILESQEQFDNQIASRCRE